jgi:hypothetical protein
MARVVQGTYDTLDTLRLNYQRKLACCFRVRIARVYTDKVSNYGFRRLHIYTVGTSTLLTSSTYPFS